MLRYSVTNVFWNSWLVFSYWGGVYFRNFCFWRGFLLQRMNVFFLYFYPYLPSNITTVFMRKRFFFFLDYLENSWLWPIFFFLHLFDYITFLQHILFHALAIWIYLAYYLSLDLLFFSLALAPCVKPAGVSALVCVVCVISPSISPSLSSYLPISATTLTLFLNSLWIWLHSSAISYLFF